MEGVFGQVVQLVEKSLYEALPAVIVTPSTYIEFVEQLTVIFGLPVGLVPEKSKVKSRALVPPVLVTFSVTDSSPISILMEPAPELAFVQ